MNKHHPQIFFKAIVGLFIAAYVVGSFANMLCIPRYVPDTLAVSVAPRPPRGQDASVSFHNTNFLQIFDRSNVDNDVINELTFAPKSVDLRFLFRHEPVEVTIIHPPQNHPYNNYQYSYLSFCTFRI